MAVNDRHDDEANRFAGRARRYGRVGLSAGAMAARIAGSRLLGREGSRDDEARQLAAALGSLKGPLMKMAQMLATIPDAVGPEYAAEFAQLQSQAPPMGWPFVRRRMASELGPDWQQRFAWFDHEASAAASLGQVHRARHHDGTELACKLQYPDMESAVEADLAQLALILRIHKRLDAGVDTSEVGEEIGARLREELDYELEARHMALYADILSSIPEIYVPRVYPELSTRRLLTMNWLDGRPLLDFTGHAVEHRNFLATLMFQAWWMPFNRYGVIHGDPHLGNYTVRVDGEGNPTGLNLLDYGCIRTFRPEFVKGVIDLYEGLRADDRDRIVSAYETWGFRGLTDELIEILNIWARFIYGPLLDNRERTIAEGTTPGEYGRREAFRVHKILKEKGPVVVPREFVFMDRAAIGLGGVFLHLDARMNWHRLFSETIEDFDLESVAERQRAAFTAAGVPLP